VARSKLKRLLDLRCRLIRREDDAEKLHRELCRRCGMRV
jgi:hypothetical protein